MIRPRRETWCLSLGNPSGVLPGKLSMRGAGSGFPGCPPLQQAEICVVHCHNVTQSAGRHPGCKWLTLLFWDRVVQVHSEIQVQRTAIRSGGVEVPHEEC